MSAETKHYCDRCKAEIIGGIFTIRFMESVPSGGTTEVDFDLCPECEDAFIRFVQNNAGFSVRLSGN